MIKQSMTKHNCGQCERTTATKDSGASATRKLYNNIHNQRQNTKIKLLLSSTKRDPLPVKYFHSEAHGEVLIIFSKIHKKTC